MLAVADEGVPRDDRKESPQSKRKGVYKGKRFPLYRGMLSPSVVFVFLYFFIFIFLGDHRGFPPILRKTLFLSQ